MPMDPLGPAIDLCGIDVDPGREPVRDAWAETPRQKVGHESAGGGCERADEHHQCELGQVAARAIAVERDHDVRGCGKRDTRLFDRDDEEEENVLVLEHHEKEKADRVADHRGQ